VQAEGQGLEFGLIQLKIFLRDGMPRWEISRSISIMDDTTSKGIDASFSQTERNDRLNRFKVDALEQGS
jgi:hypothetical protein